jgi:hypothetical protein
MGKMIIAPDDGPFRRRYYGGNPDDNNLPECPWCGEPYDPTEGHECEDEDEQ